MLRWLCYDENAIFYVDAATREEAHAFAMLYDGHVVCPISELGKGKPKPLQLGNQEDS